MEISYNELLGLISLGAMFLLFCTGFPISFIMIFSGLVFGYLGFGKVVFMLLTLQFDQLMTDSVMGAIPPFLLMGYILENAGLMDRLFRSIQMLLCRLPGSLYAAVIGTDEEWDKQCLDQIEAMGKDGGFILATGCEYPANASFDRARRMIDIAKAHTY